MYFLIPLGVCFWLLIKFIFRSSRIYTSWSSKFFVSDMAVESLFRELSFFSSRGGGGGCGRNGMKDSVKFLIPPGNSRKCVDPPSLFVKISCDPPPQTTTTKTVCWVYNDVVPTCKGHCPCQLEVWGCCKVPRAEP